MLKAALFALLALIPAALVGCGAPSGAGPALPQTSLGANLKHAPPLCIKLTDGDPNPKAGTVCSGRPYHHEVNSDVCFPTHANPCTGIGETATVQLSEKNYKGKIIAALKSARLPKAVLNNPAYPGALCDDKGTASYSEDVLDVTPTRGSGPKRSFKIKDYGPRSVASSVSVSSDCNIIFYDKSFNVVAFSIVMLTVPGSN